MTLQAPPPAAPPPVGVVPERIIPPRKAPRTPPIPRLTTLSACAGCAAKLPQTLLRELVRTLPQPSHPRLLVGSSTADDAAIYQLDATHALVQTVDFFTPIVDDPFAYGQIAATNALSDVYAMGGRPLTALNILGIPTDTLPPGAVRRILQGGAAKAAEANTLIVGGHTIRAQEPLYGLSVTGLIHPRRIMTNARARPGDLLLLTKPLGTGIATTALKRNLATPRLLRAAQKIMMHLNAVGALLGEKQLVAAATDITGFGLLGHLASMCKASGVAAELRAEAIPILSPEIPALIQQGCIPGGTAANLATADDITQWNIPIERRTLLCDAQTSGGLLLCVHPKRLTQVLRLLRTHHSPATALIGEIRRSPRPHITVT